MDNAWNLIGLAARARKISSGELVLNAIRQKKALLILIAQDASANTQKRLIDKCTFYEVPYVFVESSAKLSQAIGQTNRMSVAILDKGFATKIYDYLKG